MSLFAVFRIQRHQDFRIALAGYIAILAGANCVPGG